MPLDITSKYKFTSIARNLSGAVTNLIETCQNYFKQFNSG